MKIWIPRAKIIEPKREICLPMRISGRFKLRAVGPLGVRRESRWFDNLILDAGLDRIGASATTHTLCAVGTGSNTPTTSDTQLQSLVATTNTIQSAINATASSSPYYARKTWMYRFGQGDAEGNLAEVGVGWGSNTLFSRALIVDSEGEPTTFTVLSDEFLDVAYQLTCFAPLVDVEDTIDISGASHDIVMRAANASNSSTGLSLSTLAEVTSFAGGGKTNNSDHRAYDGSIGTITGAPSGTSEQSGGAVNGTYSSGNFSRDYTVTWGLPNGNLTGGISAVSSRMCSDSSAQMLFQCSFDPVIDKDEAKILTLTFRHSWARAA